MLRRAGRHARHLAICFATAFAAAAAATPALSVATLQAQAAPDTLSRGRFHFIHYPSEAQLASALLADAVAHDSFPGLPRPRAAAFIALAPDHDIFREWVGPRAPEWGSAIAFPREHLIVLQGRSAGSDAGDPRSTLRHELAHLALWEYLGDLSPRWFDEGYASYAARELSRDDVLATNVALALRGMPTLDELEASFAGGSSAAQSAYALSYRAVVELAELDPQRDLGRVLANWKRTGKLDSAIRESYGITLADFEQRWRSRTRRRYGMLALVGDLAVAGVLLVVLLFPLYLARRRRYRTRMSELREADAAADRAAERAREEGTLAELLAESSESMQEGAAPPDTDAAGGTNGPSRST
jgi:hypothetical protein